MARVEIYTTAFCPFCHRAVQLLKKKGVEFEQIDVTSDSEGRRVMTERAEGRHTVPQIFIDDKGIGGCDDLFELDFDGELDGLLGIA